MNTNLGIILCYGSLNTEVRDSEDILGLQKYYELAAEYFENKHEVNSIIISGGRTSLPQSFSSEATDALEYLVKKSLLKNKTLLVENTGQATSENIAFALLQARLMLTSATKIHIVCDIKWFEKVTILARILFGEFYDFEIEGIERNDSHPQADRNIQLLEALPDELESVGFQKLKELMYEKLMQQLTHEVYLQSEEDVEDNEDM